MPWLGGVVVNTAGFRVLLYRVAKDKLMICCDVQRETCLGDCVTSKQTAFVQPRSAVEP